jgi:hypothetical protein
LFVCLYLHFWHFLLPWRSTVQFPDLLQKKVGVRVSLLALRKNALQLKQHTAPKWYCSRSFDEKLQTGHVCRTTWAAAGVVGASLEEDAADADDMEDEVEQRRGRGRFRLRSEGVTASMAMGAMSYSRPTSEASIRSMAPHGLSNIEQSANHL